MTGSERSATQRRGSLTVARSVRFRHRAQLVDTSDERARSDRGPQGEDAHADDAMLPFGDHDRGGRNVEEASQPIGIVAPGAGPMSGTCKHANRGIDIGEAGAADDELHRWPSGRERQRALAAA